MNKTGVYKLVHLTSEGEYKTPLVASQLFDQAEWQAVVKDGFAPQKVEVWIVGSFREYFEESAKSKIESLRKRCPHISVKMINGIGRLKNFPIMNLLSANRSKLGKDVPVIYHCRGEWAAQWALKLRKLFPLDKVVLDVRGYWPAESIYRYGIDDPSVASGANLVEYNAALAFLKSTIEQVDSVTTVSNELKSLLIAEVSAPADTSVVPCCVSEIVADTQRGEFRKSWGVSDDEILLVYSGGTASYQHLEDLTIPFLKLLAAKNAKIKLVFFSSELEKIKLMLQNAGMNTDDIILKSYAQKEVGYALTACDAGILIRKPTLVNRVANPVKIAEYLAAGLPVIIEKGVGGVSKELFERSLMKSIEISLSPEMSKAAEDIQSWISEVKSQRQAVKEYARQYYLWSTAIHVSRKMYSKVLGNDA
ncbi:MAG: hypothetical protein H7257_07495 [Taibaiella sp.]|nr:hypothetical protein [Taibaiella sp.]